MSVLDLKAPDVAAMEALGARIARALDGHGTVYLQGELGAGKTTLTRGVLRGFGHAGAVKSPTYTLVEPYEMSSGTVFHFDLYRLLDPEELELMGYRDYFRPDALTLVEWPQRGAPLLPGPDLAVTIAPAAPGRALQLQAHTPHGQAALAALTTSPPTPE